MITNVNTDLFSVVKWNDIPDKDSIYYESYWKEIDNYVLNGYTVGDVRITNKHFWYLNLWPIYGVPKGGTRKQIMRPRFLELDFELFWHHHHACLQGKDELWSKSRQIGGSEKLASIAGYEFTIYDASQTVIVAGESKYSEHTMSNAIRGLDKLSDSPYYKRRNPNRPSEYIKAQFTENYVDSDGVQRKRPAGSLSEMYCRTAKDDPQAVSSLTPSLTICEEWGMWTLWVAQEIIEFMEPASRAEGVKTGHTIYLGTGGLAGDSVELMEKMYYDPDSYNLYSVPAVEFEENAGPEERRAIFIPKWKYEVIDENGCYLKQESIEAVMNRRLTKKGAKLLRAITQEPLWPHEAFMRSAGGYLPEEVVALLNERRAEIMKSRELRDFGERGNIFWKLDNGEEVEWIGNRWMHIVGTVFKPDPEGPFTIYEKPKTVNGETPLGVYKGATDSYDKDEANTSVSKGYTSIMKSFQSVTETSRIYVAELYSRPDRAEKFHEQSAKLCYMYQAKNLIEYSNILIFTWYSNHGMEWMLQERPYIAQAKYIENSKVANQYGMDTALLPYAYKLWSDYLSVPENVKNLVSLTQINAFINFRIAKDYNCDVSTGSAINILFLKEDEELMMLEPQTVEKQESFGYFIMKNGKLIQKW